MRRSVGCAWLTAGVTLRRHFIFFIQSRLAIKGGGVDDFTLREFWPGWGLGVTLYVCRVPGCHVKAYLAGEAVSVNSTGSAHMLTQRCGDRRGALAMYTAG